MKTLPSLSFVLVVLGLVGCETIGSNLQAVKVECDRLTALYVTNKQVKDDARSHVKPISRQPPRYPYDYVDEYYVCVGVMFDVNEGGETEDHQLIYSFPETASSRYSDEAIKSVMTWRYEPLVESGEAIRRDGIATSITFEVQ